MLKIGLTGGIASGKSSVARVLTEQGAIVLDADLIAHQVMAHDGPAFPEIIQIFGKGLLNPEGEIDRGRLGAIVFHDPAALAKLNQAVHPWVRVALKSQTEAYAEQEQARNQSFLLIWMIPLLFESNLSTMVDHTVVVYCTPAQQKSRLMLRNQLTAAEAEARIAAQLPLEDKLKLADYVIDNSQGEAETRQQILKLLGEWTWDPYV